MKKHPERPDEWDKKGQFFADEFHGRRMLPKKYVGFVAETVAAALRRAAAAAEKRGYAKAVADRKARVSEAFAREEERRRGMEP